MITKAWQIGGAMKDTRIKGYKIVISEGSTLRGVHGGTIYQATIEATPAPGDGPLTYYKSYQSAYKALRMYRSRLAMLAAERGEPAPKVEMWICLVTPSPEKWIWRGDGLGVPVPEFSPLGTASSLVLMAPAKQGMRHGVILRKSVAKNFIEW